MEIEITTSVNVNDQDIDDIMVTALEGGINYWCGSAIPVNGDYKGGKYGSDVISRGGELEMTDVEDPDEKWILNLEKFKNGLILFLKDFPGQIEVDNTIDPANIDADDADRIIQYALFNEIVFG